MDTIRQLRKDSTCLVGSASAAMHVSFKRFDCVILCATEPTLFARRRQDQVRFKYQTVGHVDID